MSLYRFLIKKVVPIPKLLKQQSFAFIGPHPDDIEVGCGATVAKLAKMSKRICFIIATDGQYGSFDKNTDKKELVATRRKEALASAKRLGVTDVRFLDFPDGGDYSVEDLKSKIAIELADFKPDIVFAPDNHMKAETHPDHIKTGRAAEIAMLVCMMPLMLKDLGVEQAAAPKGVAFYYTDRPNTFINVSDTFADKMDSLKLHESQFPESEETRLMMLYMKITAIRHGLRRFCRYAEAYRVLSSLHLHCAPEASDI